MNKQRINQVIQGTIQKLELAWHRALISKYKGKFSNFDEQAIIGKYIDLLEIRDKSETVVDIGAGDGARSSNTFALVQAGWSVLGVEYDNRKFGLLAQNYSFYPNARSCRFMVSSTNIVDLLKAYSVEKDFGVLSLDIDGCDYWVLDAILSRFRPKLVVSEFNEKIPPPVKFVVNDVPEFNLRFHFFGYSIAKLQDLLKKHDYVLLENEYNNVFIAPAEIAADHSISIEQAYLEGYVNRPDRREKFGSNEDMDPLLRMDPQQAVDFLGRYYGGYKGEYQIEIG